MYNYKHLKLTSYFNYICHKLSLVKLKNKIHHQIWQNSKYLFHDTISNIVITKNLLQNYNANKLIEQGIWIIERRAAANSKEALATFMVRRLFTTSLIVARAREPLGAAPRIIWVRER